MKLKIVIFLIIPNYFINYCHKFCSKVDVFIGGLDENILTNEHFIASHPYYEDEVTWCVQEKQPIASWKNIFYLCNDPLILTLLVFITLAGPFFAYFLQQFEDLYPKWSYFQLLHTLMGISMGIITIYKPKSISNRIFFAFGHFASILYVICILSCFKDILINPIFKDQIQSVKEIVDGSFELVGDKVAFQHIIRKNETYSPEVVKDFKICINLDECMSQLNENPKLAIAISLAHAHSSHFILPSQLYCFKDSEIIYKYLLKFLIRKNFTYLRELDQFIQMVNAGNLIKKWYSYNLVQTPKLHMDRSYKRLSLKHFHGFFLICAMIEIVLISTFILEQIVYANARAPNVSRFWKIFEMIIDPDRHFMLKTKWT